MTEEQVKFLCKLMVDKSNRPLSHADKEIIKQAIDNARTPEEMVLSIMALLQNMQQSAKEYSFCSCMYKLENCILVVPRNLKHETTID